MARLASILGGQASSSQIGLYNILVLQFTSSRGSINLAFNCDTFTDIVQARKVLELGSGAGFLGLIIAALQNRPDANLLSHTSLVLSDVNSEVLSRCRQNFLLPCSKLPKPELLL